YALVMEAVKSNLGFLLKLVQRSKANGLRRTCLGTGGRQPLLQPVVAERAFLSDAPARTHVNHAERTGRNAIPTAIARRLIDVNRVKLRPQKGAGRANFQTGSVGAVLANIRHHEPGGLASVFIKLLDEFNMPPVHIGKAAGVVVTVAAQDGQAVVRTWLGRQIIPLMTSYLACLAADADRGVGKKAYGFGHVLLRLELPFADITHEDLRLMDRNIRIADQGGQIVDHVALRQDLVSPMPGKP